MDVTFGTSAIFIKYNYLTATRIDITTAGINVTAAEINRIATTRIHYKTTGFRNFSIRTLCIF
jgi:hypothetical protein